MRMTTRTSKPRSRKAMMPTPIMETEMTFTCLALFSVGKTRRR